MAEGCKLKSVFDTQIPPRHQASLRFDLKRSVAKQNALQVNLLFGATRACLSAPVYQSDPWSRFNPTAP
jgi:hypothetical protein